MTTRWACKGCGTMCQGSTGLCQTCRSARHHGEKRIAAERITVETTGTGPDAPWLAYTSRGDMLVPPGYSRLEVVIALGRDAA